MELFKLRNVAGETDGTKREIFDTILEKVGNDFWFALDLFIGAGWTNTDLKSAGIEDHFEDFDNPPEENWDFLNERRQDLMFARERGVFWARASHTFANSPGRRSILLFAKGELENFPDDKSIPSFPACANTAEYLAAKDAARLEILYLESRKIIATYNEGAPERYHVYIDRDPCDIGFFDKEREVCAPFAVRSGNGAKPLFIYSQISELNDFVVSLEQFISEPSR